ncbi:Nucleotide-binding alpha-beta plait [Penicillium coprophilum]|uniref:Nucleotide-binding alpha-beta plait n=1 Tax=Penicillium coprophilum TaxID=36646 RepID=UPI00239B779A|nr:Nucleotide-binding alpha-beta plait [Penicillium coprophilum]KAJ5171092.1 Nucleotide-binding alpha-beta plait [Penicillium coprophilum]
MRGRKSRRVPKRDRRPATMNPPAIQAAPLTLNENANSEPRIVTATRRKDSHTRFDAHLRKSSSDSALRSQTAEHFFVPSASSISSIPPTLPKPSTPSSFVSPLPHYSSSTIHPPTPLDLVPVIELNPFDCLIQAYSSVTFQPRYWQYHSQVPPQVSQHAVDVAPQFFASKYPLSHSCHDRSTTFDHHHQGSADLTNNNLITATVFEPGFFPANNSNMPYPFELAGTTNYRDFESFESYSIEDLLQQASIPFGSATHMQVPARNGVLMISNIPYTVTRQEVASFLGRSANLLPSSEGCPIHIIMERSTGKTMDCFVEFPSKKDAEDTVQRINRAYDAGSAPRMGSRHIDIEMSTPAKLLKAIFPRAKCISWDDGNPVQLPNQDDWSTGFDGFLTDEELFCVTRHAEQPHRSVFASKVPQRCYESLITTIWKFPWHATHLYTVHHRNALFKTLGVLIRALVERMQKTNTVGLDIRLLNELVHAGLCCPGFNPRMKYCFAWWSQDPRGIESLDHDWCLYFPFDTLTYLPGHAPTALQFYAYIMSHGVVLRTDFDGLINKHTHPEIERIFGRFWFEWHDHVARETIYENAINYEAGVLRKFIITGFQHLHKRNSSISTIGTAPASPTHSLTSNDSERTISASRTGSVNPSIATQEASTFSAPRDMARSVEDGNNRNVPVNTRGNSQPLVSDQYLPDTPTRRVPPSVRPYRPPHQRNVSERTRNWRMPQIQEAPVAGPSQSQDQIRPTYRAPHATAHNVRSSSDPFAPAPSAGPTSHRSRSDAARLSNFNRRVFDEWLAAGRGKPAKK